MALELCIFRHGRTTWNALGKFQGHAESDLDELGIAQAYAVAQRAMAMQPSALYSSDLRRCKDVAMQISRTTQLEPVFEQLLRERNFGEWSGCTRQEIQESFPDQYARWMANEPHAHPNGGESLAAVCNRAAAFLELVRATHNDGVVVAVSHGGWLTCCAQLVLGTLGMPKRLGAPSQGSLTVFSWHEEGAFWRLEAYNDRGHLQNLEPVDAELPASSVF